MTSEQRKSLRDLQDRFLMTPVIREFVRENGLHHPLWEGGPSHWLVSRKLFPEHRGVFERTIAAETATY